MIFDPVYLIIVAPFFLLSMFVGNRLKSRFREYSQIPTNMTGAQVAATMLRDYGLEDVKITHVQGQLTDHYNPANKTVNLSEAVYNQRSVAAAAVAAHECGHAVQHAKAYAWLQMRSALVPVVSIAANYMQWLLLGGLIVMAFSGNPLVLAIGVAAFAMTTIFSFITLPVEFDASNRAMAWMERAGITDNLGASKARNALKWAAMTYVVAALASLAQLIYWAMLLLGRRD